MEKNPEFVKLIIDRNWIRSVWARVQSDTSPIMVILLLLLVAYVFNRGLGLGLDQGSTDRIRFHAIPVAIASLYHGFPHDYTSRKQLALTFQDMGPSIDEKIEFVRTMPGVDPNGEKYYWAADDRGMADYVIAAFKLFGPRETSLYMFYFLLLIVALSAYIAAYYRSPAMLALAVFTVAGIGAFEPILPLVDEQAFLALVKADGRGSPVGLFEPRILDILTMLSVLHIVLFAARTNRLTPVVVLALLVQITIFFFCYHARSSLGWQLLAMIILAAAAVVRIILALRRFPRPPIRASAIAFLPMIMLLAGMGALSAYKHSAYDPRYFEDMGSRTFWHNALMGLGTSSKDKSEKYKVGHEDYKVGYDDRMIVEAVLRYMTVEKKISLPPEWNSLFILESLGGHQQFDWKAYEIHARDLYWEIWSKHKLRVLSLYAFKKPLQSVKAVVRNMIEKRGKTLSENQIRKAAGLYFNPYDLPLFLFVLSAVALAFGGLTRCRDIWVAAAVLGCASFIPSVAFYSAVLTQGGMFILICIVLYLLVPVILQFGVHRYLAPPISEQ